MPTLKCLEREFPMIDSDFQRFCASQGVLSVEDFLLQDVYVLVALAESEANSEELKQGITQILAFIDTQHQPWLNGMELLEDVWKNKLVLSTGCQGWITGGAVNRIGGSIIFWQNTSLSTSCFKYCLQVHGIYHILGYLQLLFVQTHCLFHRQFSKSYHETGRSLMISAGFRLKKIAYEHNLSVLLKALHIIVFFEDHLILKMLIDARAAFNLSPPSMFYTFDDHQFVEDSNHWKGSFDTGFIQIAFNQEAIPQRHPFGFLH